MSIGTKSEYNLHEDNNLARWYNNLSKGSIIIAQVYLRRLGSFLLRKERGPAKEVPAQR